MSHNRDELAKAISENGWQDDKEIVAVQGLGFVGAVSALLVASAKNSDNMPRYNVLGFDLCDKQGKEKIDRMNKGVFPINSSDNTLQEILTKCIENKNIHCTSSKDAYSKASVVVIDIPLSLKKNQETLDWEPFLAGLRDVAENIKDDCLIIVETTMPPGTTEKIIAPLFKEKLAERNLSTENISVAHAYERVMPGPDYWKSVTELPRVYSGIGDRSKLRCRKFLESVFGESNHLLRELPTPTHSETAKVLENSYRAVNIAFIEEWAEFSEQIGVDLYSVVDVIKERPTHSNMMRPGFGVGGYCLTKDPLFARQAASELHQMDNHPFPFSSMAVDVNRKMPLRSLAYIKRLLSGSLKDKNIHVYGVSYRSELNDTRWSPTEAFVRNAEKEGAIVSCYDPYVDYWHEMDRNINKTVTIEGACDVFIICVPHNEIKAMNFKNLNIPEEAVVLDAVGVLSDAQLHDLKETHHSVYTIGKDLRL